MIVKGTPVERHELHGYPIFVKREDLCCPYPGPSFSKIRGVYAHIQARPERVIGVLDTYHSKGGWAVAYCCALLGRGCWDFWPQYKDDPKGEAPPPRVQQQECLRLGAASMPLPAGRSAILYHRAKRELAQLAPGDSYMMPNALKLPESVTENAAEVRRTGHELPHSGTLVISVSSGTVAAGVMLGFDQLGLLPEYDVVLHMGYSRSDKALFQYMSKMAGICIEPYMGITVVDEGYSYKESARTIVTPPFPMNPYYDLKAWTWLSQAENLEGLKGPIVFWNIGA